MTGKIRNLPGQANLTRIKGVAHTFYSPKWQRWITRSAQKGQGPDSAQRKRSRDAFTATVTLVKSVPPEDRDAATALAANTPYLERDLLMKASQGTLVEMTDTTGRLWMSTRTAIQQIQPMLDSISPTKGAMVVRGDKYWTALTPPMVDSVLLFDIVTAQPHWALAADLLQTMLDEISTVRGTMLYRGAIDWVALAPGVAGKVLTTLGAGADPAWEPAATGGSPFHPGWVPGNFYGLLATNTGSLTLIANTLYAAPLYVPETTLVTSAFFNVATNIAGKSLRVGIYDNSEGLPVNLVSDFGAKSVAATGNIIYSGLSFTLNQGWYWMACVSDGVPAIRAAGNQPLSAFIHGFHTSAASVSLTGQCFNSPLTFGALPSTWPATINWSSSISWPLLLIGK